MNPENSIRGFKRIYTAPQPFLTLILTIKSSFRMISEGCDTEDWSRLMAVDRNHRNKQYILK